MAWDKLCVFILVTLIVTSASCHHHHHHHHGSHGDSWKEKDHGEHARKSEHPEDNVNTLSSDVTESSKKNSNIEGVKRVIPYSARRLEQMLDKAILKIITAPDLSTADMLLLKSLNYSREKVLAIRERELNKRRDEEFRKEESSKKSWTKNIYAENVTEKKRKHSDKNVMESEHSSPNPNYEERKLKKRKNEVTAKSSVDKDFDFDAYNRQAVLDYENLASNLEFQQSWSDPAVLEYEETEEEEVKEKESPENLHRNFDKAMESHVVFKIRYDDSQFDSSSNSEEDRSGPKSSRHHVPPNIRHATSRNVASFHASSSPTLSPSTSSPIHTPLPIVYQLTNSKSQLKPNYPKNHISSFTSELPKLETSTTDASIAPQTAQSRIESPNINSIENDNLEILGDKVEQEISSPKRVSEYEGLEWVEDDVYRVIPAFADSLGYENNEENETSDYEDSSDYYKQNWSDNVFPKSDENDTLEYQNDANDSVKLFMAGNVSVENLNLANLSAYQQLALAHRRDQGQRAIEDIKSKVLALTGRFNLSTNTNQVQREKLSMFTPTCQIPRNTDPDAWDDPFSMNMHFLLNLTSGEHVVAAKLRIFKLPQENLTSSQAATFDEEEEDEKKIRISIYYYAKSLKKHRSKKRLMDSVVTPLTSEGTHLALDVRQGLRFWRLNPRNPHGNGSNHGLVIQVEDQDGRPLKPALYIQQSSCGEEDSDQKAYQRIPALFVRACTRYVRVVNGERVTYVNCRH